ncbi:hypothetical protein [Streptomyces sp. TS71-3]|uniref:hypothetical protein n=1 Tax=Streptomyces sp. TS71-3 TaxID=2733862 RepID=UPI001B217536|nr:hypothetical protein [Streptomyces sp. TS71-3]GHJ41791.1 hypothetical protein Sm713_74000 [Streptomyces sp. TS71-3]
MSTALVTDHERAAVQAYLRLLQTVRASLDLTGPTRTSDDRGSGGTAHPPVVAPSLLADADRALTAAGLAGNEREFFAMVRAWCPAVGTADD